MKKTIGALAVLAAVIAAPAATATANTTQAVSDTANDGPGWYLYPGDGVAPVHLTGSPSTGWTFSQVPKEIKTGDGTIMLGHGTIPGNYGTTPGQQYTGWESYTKGVEVLWANLNSPGTVIRNVIFHVQTSTEYKTLTGAEKAYASTCLSYVPLPGIEAKWLTLNSSGDWVPAPDGC